MNYDNSDDCIPNAQDNKTIHVWKDANYDAIADCLSGFNWYCIVQFVGAAEDYYYYYYYYYYY